ncbi:MAG: ABC transporter permease [Spirochaetota bacterium]
MRQALLIAWNDMRQSFSDASLLVLMFAAPIAIATIISVTFASAGDESSPVDELPVAVVNLDRGSPLADFGEQFVGAMDDETLFSGLERLPVSNEDEAVELLRDGTISAVIVLPADLSRRLTGPSSRDPAGVRVITRPDRELSGDIALILARGILDGFAGGLSVTQAAVAGVASAEGVSPQRVLGREAFGELTQGGSGAFGAPGRLISIEQRSLRGGGIGFNPLVVFGATQAIFFALFTANGNATSILAERRDGTLTRLLASPTRRGALLIGKLLGTFVNVVAQLVILFLAFTLVGSLLEGSLVFIWGRHFGLVALVLLATSAAASGIGGIVAASAKSPEQSNVIGTVINMFMAITGGAFGFRFDNPVRYGSAVYWGADAFEELAAGGTDIWLNIAVLAGVALVGTGVSYLTFSRRFVQ